MANKLIDGMRKGEQQAILDGLFHPGAIYRMNAIGFSVATGTWSVEIEQKIKELREDDVMLDGVSVSDFANAALDLANAEQYTGNKMRVKELIASRFEFLK